MLNCTVLYIMLKRLVALSLANSVLLMLRYLLTNRLSYGRIVISFRYLGIDFKCNVSIEVDVAPVRKKNLCCM